LNISMDMLTTPVLLVTIATNSREARFSIGPSKCYIKKATEKLVSLNPRPSAFEVSHRQVSLWKQKRSVLEEILRSEKSVISKSCSS
jgi:hypothetical protein